MPDDTAAGRKRSVWRFGVPVVCVAAGLLLGTTHGVSGGDEIRRSDSPRLVDLVREAQTSVDRLSAEQGALALMIDNHHGGSPGTDAALQAITRRGDVLAAEAGLTPLHGPGLVVTLNDAQRDAQGRFPRDASPDDLVVHQQDIQMVVNTLWSGGAEAMTIQGQRVISTTAVKCVGNTVVLHGVAYAPPYVIEAIGDLNAMQKALDTSEAVRIYKEYVSAYQLGWSVERAGQVTMPAYTGAVAVSHATPR